MINPKYSYVNKLYDKKNIEGLKKEKNAVIWVIENYRKLLWNSLNVA